MDKLTLADLLPNMGVPLRPCLPGRKLPLKAPDGSVYTFNYPAEAVAHFTAHPDHNIAVCHAPVLDSPIVCLDVDLSESPEPNRVWDALREHDVTPKTTGACWTQRTGRGNWQFFFSWSSTDGPVPTKVTNAGGLHIDLLSNGYSLTAPSDTSGEPLRHGKQGGGPYRWIKGRSPADIWITDLAPMPPAIVGWWNSLLRERQAVSASSMPTNGPGTRGDPPRGQEHWYTELVYEGNRNDRMAQIAGALAVRHSTAEVETLLLALNDRLCKPPLAGREIATIARSIGGRESRKGITYDTGEAKLLG